MAGSKAALYLRLSKEDEDKAGNTDESASIRNQRLLLMEYADRAGYEITDVYVDDDESGLYRERPGFTKLMRDAECGKFGVVIAKSQSRFSRNMEHIERILHHDFPMMGIRFIGVCDHADTEDAGNKKSRQINGLVNEWYCEDLSRNIKSVFRAKMTAGEFLGASCPYGYQKDPENHNHLVVDEYAASVVRRIFRLYLDGYGKAGIAKILSSECILIPTLYKQQVLGIHYYNARLLHTTKAWSYQTIHTILNNEVYIGNLVQNKWNKVSYKDKQVRALPREEWIVVEGTHEPIIDADTWRKAQERQNTRTRKTDFRGEKRLFSGKLFCADCKKAMAGSYTGGKFSGYLCKTYKRQGKQFCESHRISEEELKKLVSSAVRREVRRSLSRGGTEELYHMEYLDTGNNAGQERKAIQSQIQNLMRYKQGCLEQFLDGFITESDFRIYQADYEERIRVLKRQEELRVCMPGETGWSVREDVQRLLSEIEMQQLSSELVNELIAKMEIQKNGEITIYFRFREGETEDVSPRIKRSMCGNGGIYSGKRNGICKPDE